MTPLSPLLDISTIAKLLSSAPVPEAEAELQALKAQSLLPAQTAARSFAEGALALRRGALGDAEIAFSRAVEGFSALGESEAAALCQCEGLLSAIRKGPRSRFSDIRSALQTILDNAPTPRVRVVALHYLGTLARFSGDASEAQRALLEAFGESQPFLAERAQILNSLGTLYVVLGAFGAAESLLEHAAELNHQLGDAVGEAIGYGQLGAAALGRGQLDQAKKALQKQEWLASRVGDTFGKARALVWLADLALETGRPDDALMLAGLAEASASSVNPPLTLWLAYAARAAARAKGDLKDPTAGAERERARALFQDIGHPLGKALTAWDEARAQGQATTTEAWFAPAFNLATLGLSARVADLLGDLREVLGKDAVAAEVHAAAAQFLPEKLAPLEVDLVYADPDALSKLADRRSKASRNLARLAALTLAPKGLYAATIVTRSGKAEPLLPSERAEAACVGSVGGVSLWVWPGHTSVETLARDLSSLRAREQGLSARLDHSPSARVTSAPFAGETSAHVADYDAQGALSSALALSEDVLWVQPEIAWSAEAEALAQLADFRVQRGAGRADRPAQDKAEHGG